jgi:Na+/H+-dicarboxylate symporter/ABC-type amino acid transport substrate-binding protein
MSFSTRILIGLGAGVLTGLLVGERAASLRWAADGFVKLLQMTVLPYVTLSIVGSLGTLRMEEARRLGIRAGAVLAGIWAIALTFALLVPLTFPSVENASFFSTTLVERRAPFDFISLYIPANPFYSLANNIVPAVVLFAVITGVALIGVPRKQALLDVLAVASDALARATRAIVKLTPFGLFAIAAVTAGTMSLEQLGRLQVYLIAYVLVALLVSLWVLPGLVAALTPIPMREMFSLTRNALITAFVAGDLFIVLPVLIGASRTLIERHGLGEPHEATLPDVIVPASFNFPHAGKLLSVSFIVFAGWFADAAVPLSAYPRLALTSLVTFFGSLNVAVPFLLDQFKIPADTFQLFLASGVINSRFGTLVAAVHTLAVALLGSCALTGALRFDRRRVLRYAAITLVLTTATLGGTRLFFSRIVEQGYTRDQVLLGMRVSDQPVQAVVRRDPAPRREAGDRPLLEAIRERGVLRVGYLSNSLPFAYFNSRGDLVGFDVALAYRLAAELEVGLEFVPIERARLGEQMAAGACDLVMSGVAVTPMAASRMLFSTPYLDETVALIVRDEHRERFTDWSRIRAAGPLTFAVPNVPYYMDKVRDLVPQVTIRTFEDMGALLGAEAAPVDAVVFPAERGSAWTLIYPRYTVVVPEPTRLRLPLAYPMARNDQAFARLLDTWIDLKKKDGTIDRLYDYWILGRDAAPAAPRWSILRNVLHWVD